MNNRSIKATLSVGVAAAAFAFSAAASAFSHPVPKSKTYEIVPGGSFLNAGFTIEGKNEETTSTSMGSAKATQTDSVWVKLDGSKYTISSLTTDGRGLATWNSGANTTYSSYAKMGATLFGQSVISDGGSCAATSCVKTQSKSVTKNITPQVVLFGVSFWGVDFAVKGRLTGTMRGALSARGYSSALGTNGTQLDGMAENGGSGNVNLVVSAGLNAGVVSGSVGADVEVVKASAGAKVTSSLDYRSQTDLDLSWSNKAPLTVESAGGKVVAEACYEVLFDSGCAKKTLYKWSSLAKKTTTLYDDTGSLSDQTAF